MKISLKDYLKKPIGKKEKLLIFFIVALLSLVVLIDGFIAFSGIDACYEGVLASFDCYTRSCEEGTRKGVVGVNEIIWNIWLVLNVALVLIPFNFQNRLVYFVPLISLGILLPYFLLTYVINFLLSPDGYNSFKQVPLLLINIIIIYLIV